MLSDLEFVFLFQVHQRLLHVSIQQDAKFYKKSTDCVQDIKDGVNLKVLIGGKCYIYIVHDL